MISAPFHFEEATHTYTLLDGTCVPSITQLLSVAGWTRDAFYTEASRERGTIVHDLTKQYDLGLFDAVDLNTIAGPYQMFVAAHIGLMRVLRPTWRHVEVPAVHRTLRFGGRPDRVGMVYDTPATYEVKSGAPERGHAIQTALQAILVADELALPPTCIGRWAGYLDARGRYRLEQFTDRRDLIEAHRILKRYAHD